MPYVDIGAQIEQINKIRAEQEELYSNRDTMPVLAILAYFNERKPATVDWIFSWQERINKTITRKQVVSLLDYLVELGYAKKVAREIYEPTSEAFSRLKKEGMTKEVLFPTVK